MQIPAHRNILSARSSYFATMLASGFAEGQRGANIVINNTTPSAFRSLLAYLYTDKLDCSEDDIVHVMHKAHEMDEARVFAHCLRYCKINLSSPNAIGWLLDAHHYHLDELKEVASAYVASHLRRIRMVARESLQRLSEHPDLMLEVIAQQGA